LRFDASWHHQARLTPKKTSNSWKSVLAGLAQVGPRFFVAAEGGSREIVPRVLIADDHALIRRGVQAILCAFSEWQLCGEADNGNDAVRLACELKPDLVLMDVSMPGLNGIEAARRIREAQPEVKIVFLTLHDSAEIAREAFRVGAKGFLLKTEADQELVRALRVVTDQGTYVSPKINAEVVKGAIDVGPRSPD
jgi:DNA-binding NarL/FixJ family response regulator